MNDSSKVKLILTVAGIGIVGTFIALVVSLNQTAIHPDAENTVGLQNPNKIFENNQVTSDELAQQENEKQSISSNKLTESEIRIQQDLSTGAYSDLDSYLSDLENTYRDSSDQSIMEKEDRVHRVRQDLAMISGIENDTKRNGSTMLKSFSCPDTLASALLYLPLTAKYNAFMNLSGIALPAVESSDKTLVRMTENEVPEKEDWLSDLNTRWSGNFVDLRSYTAHVNEKDVDVIVVQDADTTFWRPYTIRPTNGDMTGYITNKKAIEMAEYFDAINAFDQLNDVISYKNVDLNSENFASEDVPVNRQPNTED